MTSKKAEYYINKLNEFLTSNDYSNEYLQKAIELLIDIENLKGKEYNLVKFKAARLTRMLQTEWDSSSFQLYQNNVDHPGEYNPLENLINKY